MNDILDIEIILKRQKYHPIYNVGFILIIIIISFLYISFVYNYKTYYITSGTMDNGTLKILVNVDDIKYINNNHQVKIDDSLYEYYISQISEELYVDESFRNYKYLYLKINNLNNVDNYVYAIKLLKENKKIIEYLREYL